MSLNTSINNYAMAPASPLPLAGPDESEDLSMTGLLSPLDYNLENELSELMNFIDNPSPDPNRASGGEVEVQEAIPRTSGETGPNIIVPNGSNIVMPDHQAQRPVVLGPNNPGQTAAEANRNLVSDSQTHDSDQNRFGNNNIPRDLGTNTQNMLPIQQSGAEMLPIRISEMSSARTNMASNAMIRASNTSQLAEWNPEPPPNSEYGPYREQTRGRLQQEVDNLKLQLVFVQEQSDQKDKFVKQKWDAQRQEFQAAASNFQQVASDQQQLTVADLKCQADQMIMQREQTISGLQERLKGVQQEAQQAFITQQQKFQEEARVATVMYDQAANEKLVQLLSHAQNEHTSEKQGIEIEARQMFGNQKTEVDHIQQKSEERMRHIYDEAQRHLLHKDELFVQLQREKQQMEDSLKLAVDESQFFRQHLSATKDELETARKQPSIHMIQDLQTKLD